jgi:hypothetical protein
MIRVAKNPETKKYNLADITPKCMELLHNALHVQVIALTHQSTLSDQQLKEAIITEQAMLANSMQVAFDETELRLRIASEGLIAKLRKEQNTDLALCSGMLKEITAGLEKILSKENPIIPLRRV